MTAGELIRERYEPLELLGAGGQGEVVRAFDHQHDRPVALKVRRVRDDATRQVLLREARMLLTLKPHPGLPLVREDFFVGDRYFIVMEWVEGTNLSEVLREAGGGLPLDDVAAYVMQAARALDHLHGHTPPIVHGDVKPANLVRTPEGSIVLVDFGLSTRGGGAQRPYGGTSGFSAPELAAGGGATPAADVFGLAATAFTLLAGRPPDGVRHGWPGVPAERVEQVESAIRRGLSIDPARRQPSATSLARELAGPPDADVETQPGTPPRRRRTVGGIAAAALAVVVLAVAVTRMGGGTEHRPVTADSVAMLDGGSAEVVGEARVPPGPTDLAATDDAVWVAHPSSGTVSRLDPDGRVTATVEVGGEPTALAVGLGGVWVTDLSARRMVVIDPGTAGVTGEVGVGNLPTDVAVGAGAVWVANALDGTVSRIDPGTARVTATIPAGTRPSGIVVAGGFVWVTDEVDGAVARITPDGTVAQAVPVGAGPTGIAAGAGAVWVANTRDGTVSRIDQEAGRQTTFEVGGSPAHVLVSDGRVWVTDADGGGVHVLDAATSEPVGTIPLGSVPMGIGEVGGQPWVTTGAGPDAHRGGTLTVVSSEVPFSLDPAVAFSGADGLSQAALTLTNDTLLSLRETPGSGAGMLVPDLAVAMPTRSEDGRTYTVLLRQGIRFSDGHRLVGSDVVASFERALARYDLFGGAIVGSAGCGSGTCDLTEGIETDDATGVVTFHLEEPDPDFLVKLAHPVYQIVPADTPAEVPGPVPATGPYRVAVYDRDAAVVELERNPLFEPWSELATPDGNPDRFRLRGGLEPSAAVEAVASGDADLVLDPNPDPAATEAGVAAGTLAVNPFRSTFTMGFFLNTSVPPFDDRDVRRAVSLAVDRNELLRLDGLEGTGAVTCQLIPPSLPGYRPYCPYTTDPDGSGSWKGPDLERARALVEASGTAGQPVEVWAVAPHRVAVAEHLVEVLERLGYRATLHTESDGFGAYWPAVSERGSTIQAGTIGWAPDTPSAAGMFQPIFTCDGWETSSNPSQWCDPALEGLIEEAEEVQGADPGAAGDLWHEVDRSVVDQALWIPYATGGGRIVSSPSLGNVRIHPVVGVLLGQVWLV